MYVLIHLMDVITLHVTDNPQSPMDQWMQHRDRYLCLLLEMEGLTKAAQCSLCDSAMTVKCSDCLGGNYFCTACCLKSHMRSPFHCIAEWTGSHFSPTSLNSLGFMLCLGHSGEPCHLTMEVCYVLINLMHLFNHIYAGHSVGKGAQS